MRCFIGVGPDWYMSISVQTISVHKIIWSEVVLPFWPTSVHVRIGTVLLRYIPPCSLFRLVTIIANIRCIHFFLLTARQHYSNYRKTSNRSLWLLLNKLLLPPACIRDPALSTCHTRVINFLYIVCTIIAVNLTSIVYAFLFQLPPVPVSITIHLSHQLWRL